MSEQSIAEHVAGPPTGAMDRAMDDFTKEESAPVTTPAEPASVPRETPPAASPATTAAERRAFKVKRGDAEEEVDLDEHWKDETKRKSLQDTYQRGVNADNESAARWREGQKELADNLFKRGFRFNAKVQNPKTLDDYEIVPPKSDAPAAAPTTAAPQDDEIAALAKKCESGEGTSADVLKLNRLERQREAHLAKAEREKSETTAREKTEKAESARLLSAAAVGVIDARPNVFEGVDPKLADSMKSLAWNLAIMPWKNADGTERAKSPHEAQADATEILNRIDIFVRERTKHLTKVATSPASPAPSGVPVGANGNGAASKGRPSMHNKEWLDAALDEAEQAGSRRG